MSFTSTFYYLHDGPTELIPSSSAILALSNHYIFHLEFWSDDCSTIREGIRHAREEIVEATVHLTTTFHGIVGSKMTKILTLGM